jgi:hypothetical protein
VTHTDLPGDVSVRITSDRVGGMRCAITETIDAARTKNSPDRSAMRRRPGAETDHERLIEPEADARRRNAWSAWAAMDASPMLTV